MSTYVDQTYLSALLKPRRGYIDATRGDLAINAGMEILPVGPPKSGFA
jgi:hypothetical protein